LGEYGGFADGVPARVVYSKFHRSESRKGAKGAKAGDGIKVNLLQEVMEITEID